jgi:uncharacterized protein (DUF1330 family)
VNLIVGSYGGKYLARTSQSEMVEGDVGVHQTSLILEFEFEDAALML